MFKGSGPRVFGLPPGADFPAELIVGLEQRLKSAPPEDWARAEIYVNTRRMQRRLIALFSNGPARLLPRIRLITDLGQSPLIALPSAASSLRRRLELAQLVEALLRQAPDLAPAHAAFDMADSLAGLLDEIHGEGVPCDVLHSLDVSHLSAHWERARAFIDIAENYSAQGAPGVEARQRMAVEQIIAQWGVAPPEHPVIVAGSTGSRGTTALFMAAVARLPKGAVVLPGFDFDQPAHVWDRLDDALTAEDHPQFRFRALLDSLALTPSDVKGWTDAPGPNPARNKLISLALRPAPVTDQWMEEGQRLSGIAEAAERMTLLEAPSPRMEALAIALCLRKAVDDGVTAALITPDRLLTRQVTAALDRWRIYPDDSAGLPLQLSAPGRFLRHVAALFGQKLTVEALLTLLKHPLTASIGNRGDHLRWTRELELRLRRYGPPFPAGKDLTEWASRTPDDDKRQAWAKNLAGLLDAAAQIGDAPLEELVTRHMALAEALAGGPDALWDKAAGAEARKTMQELLLDAPFGGVYLPRRYGDLVARVLSNGEVRDAPRAHPEIMIWGTLEARVQGAELVILGGLNEGSWPEKPPPDPWLNREMRKKAGLLLPERRIGLAAHDFQQAVAAKEVMLTRAIRDAEAETVPSRWLNRFTNLLNGLPDAGGEVALAEMRRRGQDWLNHCDALERPERQCLPEKRPSPRPPVKARPTKLSVTGIERLIRDPYAIYAQHILQLRRLDPLRQQPDAPLRGTILHKVLERFVRQGVSADPAEARAALLTTADEVFAEFAPWPAARRIWRARLQRVADWLVTGEIERQAGGAWKALEKSGSVTLENGFILTAKADRIDLLQNQCLAIYDYKTGAPPSLKRMEEFDKQLLLEAAMAERGGFDGLAALKVDRVTYIGLGASPKQVTNPLEDGLVEKTWRELHALIDKYAIRSQGYTARRAMFRRDDVSDYDHLSRYGEWDESQKACPEDVGHDA